MAVEIEHPKLQALYEYWDAKRDGRLAPCRADIDPTEIPDLLPNMFIYEVEQTPRDYVMRLFGTALCDLLGGDLTGKRFDEIFTGAEARQMRTEYDHVADTGEPVVGRHTGAWNDKEHIAYERLLLPLSEDGRTVDRLIGATLPEPLTP